MGNIRENIEAIRERIARAAAKRGRKPEEITLVGVTKRVDPDRILQAAQYGLSDFGENYVQECVSKLQIAQKDKIRFHFIGHLQKNKIKYIVDNVVLIQTVDSEELARGIAKAAELCGVTADILLQVNVGYETTKSGILPEGLPALVSAVSELPSIRIRGLMAIPPMSSNCDKARPYFEKMYKLYSGLQSARHPDFNILSMGMSADFEEAICEGATMVRVGTAIFGDRL